MSVLTSFVNMENFSCRVGSFTAKTVEVALLHQQQTPHALPWSPLVCPTNGNVWEKRATWARGQANIHSYPKYITGGFIAGQRPWISTITGHDQPLVLVGASSRDIVVTWEPPAPSARPRTASRYLPPSPLLSLRPALICQRNHFLR